MFWIKSYNLNLRVSFQQKFTSSTIPKIKPPFLVYFSIVDGATLFQRLDTSLFFFEILYHFTEFSLKFSRFQDFPRFSGCTVTTLWRDPARNDLFYLVNFEIWHTRARFVCLGPGNLPMVRHKRVGGTGWRLSISNWMRLIRVEPLVIRIRLHKRFFVLKGKF